MRSITTVLLTLLFTAGLQAKADITLDALEAGSGVSWPQGLRDAVSPLLGDLNSQAPHRAVAVSVDDALEAKES